MPFPGYCEIQGRTKENVNIHTAAFQRVALLRNFKALRFFVVVVLSRKKLPTLLPPESESTCLRFKEQGNHP